MKHAPEGGTASGSRGMGALRGCLLVAVLTLVAAPLVRAQTGSIDSAYPLQTLQQLEQLVAPIALYPDPLVAEILAASTFPAEVVEADRWVRTHRGLSHAALADAVDRQPWDDSIKALAAFPSVLGNMDRNLSWTSSLGEAYYNQPQDVMAAVQAMRARARAAGHLRSTPEQAVTTDGPDILIEPVSPDFVYVPEYDPWIVYGTPVTPWAGWYDYPGIWLGGAYVSFATGFSVGFVTGFEWGWHHWGCDWRGRYVSYDRGRYRSHGATLSHHRDVHGGIETRPHTGDHPGPERGVLARPDHVAGHRMGPGIALGPRYRLHPAGHGESGYRLHPRGRYDHGYPLGRYRRSRSYRLGSRHPTGGYPLHARGTARIAPRARHGAILMKPAHVVIRPHTIPRPPARAPRAIHEPPASRVVR
jgi:Protein of unknown function (DUF3300)